MTVPPAANVATEAGLEAPPVPVEHPLSVTVVDAVPVRVVHLIYTKTPGDAEAEPAAPMRATAPMDAVAATAARPIRHKREWNIYLYPPCSRTQATIGLAVENIQHQGPIVHKSNAALRSFDWLLVQQGSRTQW
jgi:hypothetical protein